MDTEKEHARTVCCTREKDHSVSRELKWVNSGTPRVARESPVKGFSADVTHLLSIKAAISRLNLVELSIGDTDTDTVLYGLTF
jgi:hypothetical protein